MLQVEGEPNKAIYSGKEVDETYLGGAQASMQPVVAAAAALAAGTLSKQQQIDAGSILYKGTCSVCHQESGEGLANVFPPLAGADFLKADLPRAIGIVLNGLTGPITVNGTAYDSVMPPMSQLNDDEIANILTYVTNSWGNSADAISSGQVKQAREATGRPLGAAR